MQSQLARYGLKSKFAHDQLINALYHLEDVMMRANIPFFLLEGAARQVYDDAPYLSLNQIDAGVQDKYMRETGKYLMKLALPGVYIDQNTISFEHNGVPIVIWIIKKHWKFFDNPDMVFYGVVNLKVPNPFERYWKSRFLTK